MSITRKENVLTKNSGSYSIQAFALELFNDLAQYKSLRNTNGASQKYVLTGTIFRLKLLLGNTVVLHIQT